MEEKILLQIIEFLKRSKMVPRIPISTIIVATRILHRYVVYIVLSRVRVPLPVYDFSA